MIQAPPAKLVRVPLLFVLALFMGLWRGELLGLKWDDIDWIEKTLEVRRNLQCAGPVSRSSLSGPERSHNFD
jgi:integrase